MALGKGFGAAVSALALVAMAAPAVAQDRHRHDHGRHHDDRDNGGAVAGALIVGGILGALLAGAGKKKAPPVVVDGPPPPPPEDLQSRDEDAPPSAFDGVYDEETAAERCATAAELEGSQDARIAQIDMVRSVVWNGKSWVVKGTLNLRDSVREPVRETRSFRCALKAGGEPEIMLDGVTA